jgi:hypothetical protein
LSGCPADLLLLLASGFVTSDPFCYPIYLITAGGQKLKSSALALLVFLIVTTSFLAAQSSQPPVRVKAQAEPQPETLPENQPHAGAASLTPQQIIDQFSARESEFYEAWIEYTYHQSADVQVLAVNGMPRHEAMTIISNIVFTDEGRRDVQIVRRAGDLRSVIFTREDEDVINNLQPFALTRKELPLYDLNFEGKERVDELTCYVFSVKPKAIKSGRFYFEGRIWVDDRDLQIVRTVGRPVPQKKNTQFPQFETIRQMIDGKYWFPVWTHADSNLHFQNDTVHIEETITYDDYKRFASKATIKFETPPE